MHDLGKRKEVIHTMATCHSLRVVDNELLGDPLDVKMFQFTGWSYEESGNRASEQANSKYDTIMPSIAKPPIAAAHTVNSVSGSSDVSYPCRNCAVLVKAKGCLYSLDANRARDITEF